MKQLSHKKINVLYITTSISSQGGIEETLRILCKYLDPAIFKIGLCSIKDNPEQILAEFQAMDIEIFALHRKAAVYDVITLWKLKQIIKNFEANIVHTHNNKANWHGRLAAVLSTNVAIVTTHHDLGDDLSLKKSQLLTKPSYDWMADLFYPIVNRLFNYFNAKVICVSKAVRAVYTKAINTRYEIIYAPFDEQLFFPQKKANNDSINLGTIGRLVWQKGHLILLQALPDIIKDYPNIHLKIIGQGDQEALLKQYVIQHNLNPYVDFCGSIQHGAGLYEGIDIYIQPSVSEGCSITILEAMASQIPVIAANLDGPKELIVHNKNGLLFTPLDSLSLQQNIIDLIKHPDKACQLSTAAFKTAQQRFASSVFIKQMTQLYQEAVSDVI